MPDRLLDVMGTASEEFKSGLFILDARTDELVGYLPSPGGHHDLVIIPRTNADLRYSRCTTT